MTSKESQHTCYFRLEQTANGYLTGNLVCSYCQAKIPVSWSSEHRDSASANSSGGVKTQSTPYPTLP